MADGIVNGGVSRADAAYYDLPGVARVVWDPTCGAVHVEWQGWANPAEFRAANQALVRALIDHRASRALGDLRNMKAIQQSDQDWAQNEWLTEILGAGLRKMALVISKSGIAMMNVESILSRVPGTKLDVGYFATIGEARAWLNQPTIPSSDNLKAVPRV